MRYAGPVFVTAFVLISPLVVKAQTTGRVECARSDGYVSLYSSMTTLDVRATVQCGELIQITGRYDAYFGARTSKGEVGYVPVGNVVALKDQAGSGLPAPSSTAPGRERTPYDARPAAPPAPAHPVVAFGLAKDTIVRVKLLKPLSSATAHSGDPIEFEVLEDIKVEGVTVIVKGAKAIGRVAEVEPKKRFGHDGKIAFNINSVRLTDDGSAPLRGFFEAFGASPNATVVQLSSGKDGMFAEGTEFTGRIDGDFPLKREAFDANSPKDAPTSPTTN